MKNFLEIVNVHDRVVLINVERIESIEESISDTRYNTIIFMVGGSNHKTTETLEVIQEKLKKYRMLHKFGVAGGTSNAKSYPANSVFSELLSTSSITKTAPESTTTKVTTNDFFSVMGSIKGGSIGIPKFEPIGISDLINESNKEEKNNPHKAEAEKLIEEFYFAQTTKTMKYAIKSALISVNKILEVLDEKVVSQQTKEHYILVKKEIENYDNSRQK